jgi:hypothetical protein
VPHSPGETVAEVIDLENPPPSKDSQLPCPAAIEFLADIYELEGGNGIPKTIEVYRDALSCIDLLLMKVVVMEVTGKRAGYHPKKVRVVSVMRILLNLVSSDIGNIESGRHCRILGHENVQVGHIEG